MRIPLLVSFLLLGSLAGAVEVGLSPQEFVVHVDDNAGYLVLASTIHDVRGDVSLEKREGNVVTSFRVTYVDEKENRSQEYRQPVLADAKPKPFDQMLGGNGVQVRCYGLNQIFVHPSRHAYARVEYQCLGGTVHAPTEWPDGFTFSWLKKGPSQE